MSSEAPDSSASTVHSSSSTTAVEAQHTDTSVNTTVEGGGAPVSSETPYQPRAIFHYRPKVAVGSQNPVKITACRQSFMECFVDDYYEFLGYDVDSQVSDQPFTDEEARQGATNRAKNAAQEFATKNEGEQPAFSIGLEGGVMKRKLASENDKDSLVCFAWMAVLQPSSGKIGYGRTAEFALPDKVAKLVIEDGMELGDADDKVFGRLDSKKKDGYGIVFTRN
eukprot:gb/GECG01003281.1/.p1 GENE.gb/GECG01003281.1/~~gb/GECG01003281.1/.p1  ORF type:complete len:223 (+),score=37.12 gb/GECG01003281.1/:1-669(+)